MTLEYVDDWLTIHGGDARTVLADLPDESVHCVVTSPPYWGLRDYGTATWIGGDEDCDHDVRRWEGPKQTQDAQSGHASAADRLARTICGKCGATRIDSQLGLEATPEEYVTNLVAVFREVRRVLRKDGTLWLNLGDSYSGSGPSGASYQSETTKRRAAGNGTDGSFRVSSRLAERGLTYADKKPVPPPGLKPKDLVGIPWMVARALQAPYYTGRIASSEDRAWLAAAIDGEGCIYIQRRLAGSVTGRVKADGTRSGYTADQYQPGVRFTNTNEAFVRRVAELAGVGAVRAIENDGRRNHFEWSAYSQEARDFLRELYPHLVAKQHEARLAIGCKSTGGEDAWMGLKALHHGVDATVDFPAPASMFEPGWYLRSDVIWNKANPMPESVTDRPTKSHEYLFLLTRSPRYFFDSDAVRETDAGQDHRRSVVEPIYDVMPDAGPHTGIRTAEGRNGSGRNIRSVWTIATQPYPGAHFAVFPEKLVEPCILAGTSERGVCPECGAPWERMTRSLGPDKPNVHVRSDAALDGDGSPTDRGGTHNSGLAAAKMGSRWAREHLGWRPSCVHVALRPSPAVVLDCFAGSGTVARVANRLSRRAILIDLNPEYLRQQMERNRDIPMGLAG